MHDNEKSGLVAKLGIMQSVPDAVDTIIMLRTAAKDAGNVVALLLDGDPSEPFPSCCKLSVAPFVAGGVVVGGKDQH